MLDALGNAVRCPLSQQMRTFNEINDLAKPRKNPMVRRSSLPTCERTFHFWG